MKRVLLAIALACWFSAPVSAEIRILRDPGGQIGPYLEKLASWDASGESIIVDGPCLSACTLVLGVIPHERVCATRRARFGFHAAWRPMGIYRVRSNNGTALLMKIYPPRVKAWIKKRGGLNGKMIFARGSEIGVRPCR